MILDLIQQKEIYTKYIYVIYSTGTYEENSVETSEENFCTGDFL